MKTVISNSPLSLVNNLISKVRENSNGLTLSDYNNEILTPLLDLIKVEAYVLRKGGPFDIDLSVRYKWSKNLPLVFLGRVRGLSDSVDEIGDYETLVCLFRTALEEEIDEVVNNCDYGLDDCWECLDTPPNEGY